MKNKKAKGSEKVDANFYIESAGSLKKESIVETLEKNYMPYAMSVILSRAIPQIDGFKPSHRKLLYTMYTMGLLKGKLTKSANIVGATMKLNPHGDAAIYETMVRLSRGYEALLHPYVESKGNFGKFYSRDMAYAASRYTEAKLSPICEELFSDIDKDAVDFVPNYDNSTKEPVLFPIKFPAILVNSNVGIAVSMACSICPFNLIEVCKATIKFIKKEKFDFLDILKGPDFPGGGFIVKDEAIFSKIYETGRGSFKVRSKYIIDKENSCIDIVEIPYTTTVEAIIEKIVALIKQNKIKEIADIRDETDLNGLKITIDLKRGVNAKNLMNKLFKYTPLEDSYACNFNILVDGVPKIMGISGIISQWQMFRQKCIKRRTKYELLKKEKKLHLLEGLNRILLDVDKAIKIIRLTEKEEDVVLNLMAGFKIDELQAEYVCEIKLRHLNRQYIINKTAEKETLKQEIKDLKTILENENKVNEIICKELEETIEKYGKPRKSMFLFSVKEYDDLLEEEKSDYLVNLFLTKEGYLKKITTQSLRLSHDQKLKENDFILFHKEVNNDVDVLFFTNKARMYKANLSSFKETKASLLGDFIPAIFKFDDDEKILDVIYTKKYDGNLLFFYEDGRAFKVSLNSYKTNRKKLLNVYDKENKIVKIFCEKEDCYFLLQSTNEKIVIINSNLVELKAKKGQKGVFVFRLNKNCKIKKVVKMKKVELKDYDGYVFEKIPASGKAMAEQLKLK